MNARQSRGRFTQWLTSVSGIATAVAGIMTSAATLLGFFAAHQYSQIQHQTQQIQHQTQQIKQLRARQPVTAKPANASSVTGGGAPSSSSAYLSNQQPTVNNGSVSDEGTTLSGQGYPNSVVFYCSGQSNGQPTQAWDVGGRSTFTAVIGVPDDSQYVTGIVGTLTFTSQDGKQLSKNVNVSLGHPARVSLNISDVTQLDVTCNATNPANNGASVDNLQVALADARVS